MSSLSANRLNSELKTIKSNPNLALEFDDNYPNIWYISFKGADKTLYENETFKLRFEFGENYPLQKPSVIFVENIPINPFVFSNGLICLDILDTEWSPVLNVSSVTMSILSMLSETKEKRKPINDEIICKKGIKNFNDGKWRHHYINV